MNAYSEALKILGRRRRSSHELSKKLTEKKFSLGEISEAVKKCTDKGFLNDPEFIEDFIQALKKKGFGPYMIRRKLQEKFALAESAIPFIEGSLEIALKKPKYERLLVSQKGKQKVIAALLRKGFELGEILRKLQS